MKLDDYTGDEPPAPEGWDNQLLTTIIIHKGNTMSGGNGHDGGVQLYTDEGELERLLRREITWQQSTHNRLGQLRDRLDQIFGALVVIWLTIIVGLVAC